MAEDDGILWIIEAMRKVHKQKQRRTVDRIVNAVRQKYDISTNEIASLLEKAEQCGIIHKIVDNTICFYKECNSTAQKQYKRSVVHNVLSEVIMATLKGSDAGYSMKTLMKNVRTRCSLHVPDDFNWKHQMYVSVKRLIKEGLVQRVGNVLWLASDAGGRNGMQGKSDEGGLGVDINDNNGLAEGMKVKSANGSAGDATNCSLARCTSKEHQDSEAFDPKDTANQVDEGSAVKGTGVHHHKKKPLRNAVIMKRSKTLFSHCRLRHDFDLSNAAKNCSRRRSLRLTSSLGSNCADLNKHTEKEHSTSRMINRHDVCLNSQCEAVASSIGADEGASSVMFSVCSQDTALQFITSANISLCDEYLDVNNDCVVSCAELIDDIISCVAPEEALNAKSNTLETEVKMQVAFISYIALQFCEYL